MTNGVYSEFECQDQRIKFKGEDSASALSCVSAVKENPEVKSIVKKCRGVEIKRKTKIIGMTIEETVHVPHDVYTKMCSMNDDDLKEGVTAYNSNNSFKTFCLTLKVLDEDDVIKYKAYPNCVLSEAPERAIDNSAEEVAELTLKIQCMRDEYGMFEYEAIEDKLSEDIKTAWMENFTQELVHNTSVA